MSDDRIVIENPVYACCYTGHNSRATQRKDVDQTEHTHCTVHASNFMFVYELTENRIREKIRLVKRMSNDVYAFDAMCKHIPNDIVTWCANCRKFAKHAWVEREHRRILRQKATMKKKNNIP